MAGLSMDPGIRTDLHGVQKLSFINRVNRQLKEMKTSATPLSAHSLRPDTAVSMYACYVFISSQCPCEESRLFSLYRRGNQSKELICPRLQM